MNINGRVVHQATLFSGMDPFAHQHPCECLCDCKGSWWGWKAPWSIYMNPVKRQSLRQFCRRCLADDHSVYEWAVIAVARKEKEQ